MSLRGGAARSLPPEFMELGATLRGRKQKKQKQAASKIGGMDHHPPLIGVGDGKRIQGKEIGVGDGNRFLCRIEAFSKKTTFPLSLRGYLSQTRGYLS